MPATLIRATTENQELEKCRQQWDGQIADLGDDAPTEFYHMPLDQAEDVVERRTPNVTDDYGIYVLKDTDDDEFIALIHINHMHRQTSEPILKMLWAYISPKYNSPGQDHQVFAKINTMFIICTLQLKDIELPSKEIKIYMQNEMDRRVYSSVAASMNLNEENPFILEIRGSWLHIYNR